MTSDQRERPTEALQRRIDGDGQGLMFKDGQAVPMRPVPVSELREAVDTIAALTAEVGRLREGIDYALTAGTYGVMEGRLRALAPPADQPAPATKPCLECKGSGFSVIGPPLTEIKCHKCNGTGRVPAPKNDNPCTFPRCDCTSAVCPKEDER